MANKNKKITIIGLGLIGSSLARALRQYLGITNIIAINRSMEPINEAIKDGCILRGFSDINAQIENSDIIFICTPVKSTIDYIRKLSVVVNPNCIITDVGSTKGEIISFVNNMPSPPCFVGGHPMTGTEKTGYSAGIAHLFENAYYVLTPCKSTTESALDHMINLVKGIGGIPVIMDADEHDTITGGVSHVPHIIASSLVNLVKELDSKDRKMQMLAAGGFRDITRIASSSPEIWENIVMSNKKKIIGILDVYLDILNRFKTYMKSGDSKKIYRFFQSAKDYRDLFSSERKGLITPVHDIIVDVVDEPGTIGKIATLLGENKINIKNINVSNSREFEQGCLRVTLPDSKSVNIAFDLLRNSGYKVYKGG
jgi:prephenate dehydrogenase